MKNRVVIFRIIAVAIFIYTIAYWQPFFPIISQHGIHRLLALIGAFLSIPIFAGILVGLVIRIWLLIAKPSNHTPNLFPPIPPHLNKTRAIGSLYAIRNKQNQSLRIIFTTELGGHRLREKFGVFYYKRSIYESRTHDIDLLLRETHYDERFHERFSDHAADPVDQHLRRKAIEQMDRYIDGNIWIIHHRVKRRIEAYVVRESDTDLFLSGYKSTEDLVLTQVHEMARVERNMFHVTHSCGLRVFTPPNEGDGIKS